MRGARPEGGAAAPARPGTRGVEPAEVALASLLGLPQVVVIPGASSVEQLEFTVAAAEIDLDPAAHQALTDAARAFAPVGGWGTATDAVRERFRRQPAPR